MQKGLSLKMRQPLFLNNYANAVFKWLDVC